MTEGHVETSISTTMTIPTTRSVIRKLKDKQNTEKASLKIGASFKDTEEFMSLIAQLNNTFYSLWTKKEVKREREEH